MWADTHCHVADEKFAADREDVLARALAAGVTLHVEIAESPETWDAAIALAERHTHIYAALGIHPHHAHIFGPAEWPTIGGRLKQLLTHPKVVAVGEFGLDYFRMRNTAEQQDYLFRQQLDLAQALEKPIVIHCREAHADVRAKLLSYFPETSEMDAPVTPPGVIHCFTGTWDDAAFYLHHGFMLGIDGPVTYPKNHQLHQNVNQMPLNRIVLETDSPYLPPQAIRGERNEPKQIPAIGAAIAELKRIPASQVAHHTTANAQRLFRVP